MNKRLYSESLRVRISKEQLEGLQQLAEARDRPIGYVVREAINDLLNGKKEPQ